MTKQDCAASISTILTSTARWRTGLDQRYPDYRNQKAARLLTKLSGEASSLTDAQWQELAPHYGSPRWGESLKQTARLVGFHRRRVSLRFFVSSLARALSATPYTA